MDGVFLRKKVHIWYLLLAGCGLFLIGMYIFFSIVDSEAGSEVRTFLIMGILILLVVIPSWLFNFRAFLHVDEDAVQGKYHWFGRIDCKLSEITFVTARVNTLIIQLRDGRTHTIMGLANPWPIASYLRRRILFEGTTRPEVLIEKRNNLKAARKKGLIYVCSGVALMFILILVAVFLTGEKEMHEFSRTDWIVFTIIGVMEIATVITTFYFANQTGHKNIPIEKLQYEIQRGIIETQPLLPGYIVGVYADEIYACRIILFGYPHVDAVYYVVQEFVSDYTLTKTYASETYETRNDLPESFEMLVDITSKVLH